MDQSPSVLIVSLNYAPESTGIAPYSTGLAVELARRGHRVRAITGFAHYPQWSFLDHSTRRSEMSDIDVVRVVRRRHSLPSKPTGLSRAWSELSFGFAAARTRFGHPGSVVLVSPALISSAIVLVKARLLMRVPVVMWVQDLYSLGLRELGERRPSVLEKAVSALEKWCLRFASHVVVIHERFRDTVVDEFGLDPSSVTVVRNWSHLSPASSGDRLLERAALGWQEGDFVVLHAGNMGVKQGLENVVEASRLAASEGSAVKFVLLGDGNQRLKLAELAADIPALEMIGSLPDDQFGKALRAADVLLVNERRGVTGMAVPSKLTSYFSTGLPVIAATDSGSVTESEVVLAGAGLVVPAGDPTALLRAAERLANDPVEAAEMGNSGMRFRSTRLTATASFDIFTQLLKRLAGRRTSAKNESGNG